MSSQMSSGSNTGQVPLYQPTPIGANRGLARTQSELAASQRRVADLETQHQASLLAQQDQARQYVALESDLKMAQLNLQHLQDEKKHAGPALLVAFIDGEVLTFPPEQIEKGREGGKYCVLQLQNTIKAGLDIMGSDKSGTAAIVDQPSLVIHYLFDFQRLQTRLRDNGHHMAAVSLPDFVTGLADCIVLNTNAAGRVQRLQELLDVFGYAPNVRQLFLGGCVPPLHMRYWLEDTFTAEGHPAVKKLSLLTTPGSTNQFSDETFTDLEASYYTRLVLEDVFRPIDAEPKLRIVTHSKLTTPTEEMGRPISRGSASSQSSSAASSRLTYQSAFKSSTSSASYDWSLSTSTSGTKLESPQMMSPDESKLSVETKTLSPTSRRRERTMTAPADIKHEVSAKQGRVSAQRAGGNGSGLTVPGMVGHQRATSANSALTRSRTQGITYAAFQEYERSGNKHPNFAGAPRLDKSRPLSKQSHPPCNNFYLSRRGCMNHDCKYSHSYRLSRTQLDELSKGARHAKCHFIKRGEICPAGVDCIFGLHDKN